MISLSRALGSKCQRLTFLSERNVNSFDRLTRKNGFPIRLDSSKFLFRSSIRSELVDRKQNPHCRQWEHDSINDNGSVRFSRSWAICEYWHYGCDLFNLYSNLYEKRYTRRLCSGCKTMLKHRHTERITHGRAINRRSHIKRQTIKVTLRDDKFLHGALIEN